MGPCGGRASRPVPALMQHHPPTVCAAAALVAWLTPQGYGRNDSLPNIHVPAAGLRDQHMHRQSWSFPRLRESVASMSPSSQKRKPRSRQVDRLVQDHMADDNRASACAPSQALLPSPSAGLCQGPGFSPRPGQLCHHLHTARRGRPGLSPQVSGPSPHMSPPAFLG